MKTNKWILLLAAVMLSFAACNKAKEAAEDTTEVVEEATEEVVEAVANVWEQEVAKAVIAEAGAPAEAPAGAVSYTVDLEKSQIEWKGSKPIYSHNGTVNIQSGSLSVVDGQLAAGEFVIDMTSIKDLDVEDPEKRADLEAHLKGTAEGKADDFFNTTEYPTAQFVLTQVAPLEGTKFMLSGNLTIKGITHEVTFPANVEITDEGVNAVALFSVDRTKWNVNFNSGNFFKDLAAEQVISDDMGLNITLATK